MKEDMKREMFILGAKAAAKFLREFRWEDYKVDRTAMQTMLKEK